MFTYCGDGKSFNDAGFEGYPREQNRNSKKSAHFMRDVDFRNALKLAALFFFSLSGEGSLRRKEELYRTPYGVSIRIS